MSSEEGSEKRDDLCLVSQVDGMWSICGRARLASRAQSSLARLLELTFKDMRRHFFRVHQALFQLFDGERFMC